MYLEKQRVDGRYAFISGGARGIGYCTAEAFIEAGAAGVVIADINKESLDEALEKLRSKDARVEGQCLI